VVTNCILSTNDMAGWAIRHFGAAYIHFDMCFAAVGATGPALLDNWTTAWTPSSAPTAMATGTTFAATEEQSSLFALIAIAHHRAHAVMPAQAD